MIEYIIQEKIFEENVVESDSDSEEDDNYKKRKKYNFNIYEKYEKRKKN